MKLEKRPALGSFELLKQNYTRMQLYFFGSYSFFYEAYMILYNGFLHY